MQKRIYIEIRTLLRRKRYMFYKDEWHKRVIFFIQSHHARDNVVNFHCQFRCLAILFMVFRFAK